MACATAMPMGAHAAEQVLRQHRGEAASELRFAAAMLCVSLGRGEGLIQLLTAEDRPRARVVRGRAAAVIKEAICRMTVVALRAVGLAPRNINAAGFYDLIASLGIGTVAVRRRLRVAFFSTGDEVVNVGTPAGDGQIYDSNRYTLHGLLTRLGADILDLGVVPDRPEALEAVLARRGRAEQLGHAADPDPLIETGDGDLVGFIQHGAAGSAIGVRHRQGE